MRKWSVAAGIALAIIAIVITLLPFDRPAPRRTYTYGSGFTASSTCASPIVSAWRRERPESGWFGYAPLTSNSLATPCRGPARHRLLIAAFPAVGALLLLLVRRRSGNAPNPDPTRAV